MNFEKTYGSYDLTAQAKWYTHPDGGEFFIAPLNNNVQVQEILKSTKVKEDDDLSLYDTKEVSCKIMSKSILIDWKNIESGDGKELKYSVENAEAVLVNYLEFSQWVLDKATELSEEHRKEKEELLKK